MKKVNYVQLYQFVIDSRKEKIINQLQSDYIGNLFRIHTIHDENIKRKYLPLSDVIKCIGLFYENHENEDKFKNKSFLDIFHKNLTKATLIFND